MFAGFAASGTIGLEARYAWGMKMRNVHICSQHPGNQASDRASFVLLLTSYVFFVGVRAGWYVSSYCAVFFFVFACTRALTLRTCVVLVCLVIVTVMLFVVLYCAVCICSVVLT